MKRRKRDWRFLRSMKKEKYPWSAPFNAPTRSAGSINSSKSAIAAKWSNA
jgi:hypothetical protein